MKVVILHDWLTGHRGGERVLEAICELYPDAPIYTLLHQKGSAGPIIESKEIVTSFLDRIPGIYENYRFFLPLMPLAASLLKITHQADLVISSSHCVIKGVTRPAGSKHLCYIHSPMRYIYDQFDHYFGNKNFIIKTFAKIIRPYLACWDKFSNKNVDLFLANSEFIKKRMINCYGPMENVKVIYPFVDLKDFSQVNNFEKIENLEKDKKIEKHEKYYLMVTAFAPNKRVDLAIKAFNILGYHLKVIGGGSVQEISSLTMMAKNNIEFLGKLSREQVIDHMVKAEAFIFPGVEDFGITPLESLAAGTPVIAFRAGGVLETLDENCAYFFDEANESSLIAAIKKFESSEPKNKDYLRQRAQKFSKEIFIKKFTDECLSLSLKSN